MIRKLRSGEYRLYSRKVDPKTSRWRTLENPTVRKLTSGEQAVP
jgi:hypothetical protein